MKESVAGHELIRHNAMVFSLYAMRSRALPILPDGLKTSQRALIYSAYKLGLKPEGKTMKSTRPVSTCMSEFHPHGDASLYTTLANMTSNVSVSPFTGQGNWGYFGEPPAAARYTETKLSEAGWALVDSLKENSVQFVPNFDDTTVEPEYLPAKWSVLAINGAKGIAVGFACVHPPYNPSEVMDLVIEMVKAKNKLPLEKVREIVPAPDYPNGGNLYLDQETWEGLMLLGEGKFLIRSDVKTESLSGGKTALHVVNLPQDVANTTFIAKVKSLIRENKLEGISGIDDHSDMKNGMDICIEVKRGVDPKTVLSNLYALTQLESSVSVNGNVVTQSGDWKRVGLLSILRSFIEMRKTCIRATHLYKRETSEKRLHLVEGLLKVELDIDKAVKIIRGSQDKSEASQKLCKSFKIDEEQAAYVLSLQLGRLTKMDAKDLRVEQKNLKETIDFCKTVETNESFLTSKVLLPELKETRKLIGRERQTKVFFGNVESSTVEKQVAKDISQVFVDITSGGLRRLQNDNGSTKEFKDVPVLLGVTDKAQCALVDVAALTSSASNQVLARGSMNGEDGTFVDVFEPDKVPPFLTIKTTPEGVKAKRGIPEAQKTGATPFMPIHPGETLEYSAIHKPGQFVLLVTTDGKVHKFDPETINLQGKAGNGVAAHGENLGQVLAIFVADDNETLYTRTNATEKVTKVSDIPVKGRTSNGVVTHKFLKVDSEVVEARLGGDNPTPRGSSGNKI